MQLIIALRFSLCSPREPLVNIPAIPGILISVSIQIGDLANALKYRKNYRALQLPKDLPVASNAVHISESLILHVAYTTFLLPI